MPNGEGMFPALGMAHAVAHGMAGGLDSPPPLGPLGFGSLGQGLTLGAAVPSMAAGCGNLAMGPGAGVCMPGPGGPVRYDCPDCGRSYSHNSTLWSHRRYECGKEPQFQCPCCPHRSKLKKNLVKHIRSRHAVDMAAMT